MKKVILTFVVVVFCITAIFAQDVKKESQKAETKMEAFASKTGTIIKFQDYNLPNLKLHTGGIAETRIRKFTSGGETKYFYQITKPGQYGDKTASIEYSDLLEVIKALNSLKSDLQSDIAKNPDYLENKFVTEDGFQLGYYVSSGKSNWYMKLEKYSSGSTIFIKQLSVIENAFNGAKAKIEELKSSN